MPVVLLIEVKVSRPVVLLPRPAAARGRRPAAVRRPGGLPGPRLAGISFLGRPGPRRAGAAAARPRAAPAARRPPRPAAAGAAPAARRGGAPAAGGRAR